MMELERLQLDLTFINPSVKKTVFIYDLVDLTRCMSRKMKEIEEIKSQLLAGFLQDDNATSKSNEEESGSASDHYAPLEKWPDCIFDDYYSRVEKCLRQVNTTNSVNVVLCDQGTSHGWAQLSSFELGYIRRQHLYSTATRTIGEVLKTIQTQFGELSQFVVISSNNDTLDAAKKLLIPNWPIRCSEDFVELCKYQRDYWLSDREHTMSPNSHVTRVRYELQQHQKRAAILAQAQAEAQAQIEHSLRDLRYLEQMQDSPQLPDDIQ